MNTVQDILLELKNDSRTKSIPVVIMTSSSEERDLVEGYNLGVNSYIQKPVDFEQFRKTVKTLGLYRLVVNQSPIGLSRSTKTGSVPLSISAEQVDGVVDLGRAIVLVNIQAKRLF